MTRRSWLTFAFTVLFSVVSLPACGPLPTGEYWNGFFRHVYRPKYSFEVPSGWREAKVADYPSLAFNRRIFAGLDDSGRQKLLQGAELELQALDTGLVSSQGAWIQVRSAARFGEYAGGNLVRYGLSGDKEKQALWERFAAARIQGAPPEDKPVLTLEVVDLAGYGSNQFVRVRFRSDELRGSLYWTVLGLYTEDNAVLLAHLGTPEDREEGMAGFEAIAASLRWD